MECQTFEEFKQEVDDDMIYYNYDSLQWSLKNMVPVDYRNHILNVS